VTDNVEGLWEKLKRRKVVQWGLAYTAAAWAFLQGFEYVGEAFGWPGELRRVAIFASLMGLPITIILAWYHGERGRQRVTATEATTIALLAAAGVLFTVAAATTRLTVRPGVRVSLPLTDARFTTLTDFDGIERDAAISRDGQFVAFLSDHNERIDAWVMQIGSGESRNLTPDEHTPVLLLNEAVRNVGFSFDGSQVLVWGHTPGSDQQRRVGVWSVPTLGGALRPLFPGVVEFAWSSDGTRLVYHTGAAGDPIFVTEPGEQEGRQIYKAPAGTHCHFPIWSPDDGHIYFVRGKPPDVMDLWRMRTDGTGAERLTDHDSLVTYPVFIDARRLLYLATTTDGSGPWLHMLDTRTRESRRLSVGAERYQSLAASDDGRRLVATVVRPRSQLWRVPISDSIADSSTATRIALPTSGGRSPRIGPGYLLYVASKREQEGIWKLEGDSAAELWSRPLTRLVGAPAISPDGQQIAFTAEQAGHTRLHLMAADGSEARMLATSLEVAGGPTWAPGGQALAVAALRDGEPAIFEIPLGDDPPRVLVDRHAGNPYWSPDGQFLFYNGPQVGSSVEIRAVGLDGSHRRMPTLTLMRRAERIASLPGGATLVVLRGEVGSRDFALFDLQSGSERRLTAFEPGLAIEDFDVAADGSEIVFDRRLDQADIVLIERSVD
jgi:Tol biopolymer transport system component